MPGPATVTPPYGVTRKVTGGSKDAGGKGPAGFVGVTSNLLGISLNMVKAFRASMAARVYPGAVPA